MYQVVKTYGHDLGLSAVFRQWRAVHSHCSVLHGYALAVTLKFEAEELDDRNWVIDFGGLKEIKEWLKSVFDHKLLVAEDDPEKDEICALAGLGIADVLVIPSVGCEGFARYIYDHVGEWLFDLALPNYPRLVSVEVAEHGGNSAIYCPSGLDRALRTFTDAISRPINENAGNDDDLPY